MTSQNSINYKDFFLSSFFQEKWQHYVDAFGSEINEIFGSEYDKKIRIANGLEHLINNELNDAYNVISKYELDCVTKNDKKILNKLIERCLNREEMSKVVVGDWIKQSKSDYYQVIKITPSHAVIKSGFDSKLNYRSFLNNYNHHQICVTSLDTYQTLSSEELSAINDFFTSHPEESDNFSKNTERMLLLREKIINGGMSEAKWDFRQFYFFRETTDKTAFIINLKDFGEYIRVVYGFISTAIFFDAPDHLSNYGEDDGDIVVRFSAKIKTDEDWNEVKDDIKNTYYKYYQTDKDELLSIRKQLQKDFLSKIHSFLKPLGFKKKGTKWIKVLENDFGLEFYAQKSAYSDQYYFNISVIDTNNTGLNCYYIRLLFDGSDIHNWQLMSDNEISELMNSALNNTMLPIMNTPLDELGKQSFIWNACICSRQKCADCWVEKNIWEATKGDAK